MTSTATARTTDTIGVVKQLRRLAFAFVVGLFSILAVPGIALAHTDPGLPDSVTVPTTTPAVYPAATPQPSASPWGLTSTLLIVGMAIVAVAIVVIARRTARRRRAGQLTALTA